MNSLLNKFKQLQAAKVAANTTPTSELKTVAQEVVAKESAKALASASPSNKDAVNALLLRAKSKMLETTTKEAITAGTSTKTTALGSLLNAAQTSMKSAASVMDDAVAAKWQKGQETGLYDIPDSEALEGLDTAVMIDKMRRLDEAVIRKTPELPNLCRDIRANLEQYPELTHILTEEQLGLIVSGYLTQANIETSPKTPQAKAAKNKTVLANIGDLSMDEFF